MITYKAVQYFAAMQWNGLICASHIGQCPLHNSHCTHCMIHILHVAKLVNSIQPVFDSHIFHWCLAINCLNAIIFCLDLKYAAQLTSCPELDNPWRGFLCIFIFSPKPPPIPLGRIARLCISETVALKSKIWFLALHWEAHCNLLH